ncbi:hypothetical protein C0995_013119 [Termitomyces sp. Mi166|nr:hypothetical protein C0995_013119 [Termitomyces sp. Mi166\
MPSPYAIIRESHEELWFEQSDYISTYIASMYYGKSPQFLPDVIDTTGAQIKVFFPVLLVPMIINIVLSAMIAVRILMLRRVVKSSLGSEYAKSYGVIAAIIFEATLLPFTILSIVTFGIVWWP